MSEQPAGWYPDPYAAIPGTERWWDGAQWLAQTREAQPAHGAPGVQPAWQRPAPQGAWQPQRAEGPDGVELASWGRRLGAYALDLIPFIVLSLVIVGASGYFDAVSRAVASGDEQLTEAMEILAPGSQTAVTLTVVTLFAQLLYNVGLHATTGQTIGKRLVGIRLVRADEPTRSPGLPAASLRWLIQLGAPQALQGVPVVGFLVGLFGLADHLWPLWDQRNQALHDKAARTLVVRVR